MNKSTSTILFSLLLLSSVHTYGQDRTDGGVIINEEFLYDPGNLDFQGNWQATRSDGNKIILSGVVNTNIEIGNLSTADINAVSVSSQNVFKIKRDAGTFFFEGSISKLGNGSGRFYYRMDSAYINNMNSLGFSNSKNNTRNSNASQFFYAVHDVSYEFAKEMKDNGYSSISLEQLMKLRSSGVNSNLIRTLSEIGYKNLSPDDLILLSVHEVPMDYIKELNNIGFENISISDLMLLHVQKVPIKFIKSVIGNSTPLPTARELALIWMYGDKVSRFK
jgi:hypothetical protein